MERVINDWFRLCDSVLDFWVGVWCEPYSPPKPKRSHLIVVK